MKKYTLSIAYIVSFTIGFIGCSNTTKSHSSIKSKVNDANRSNNNKNTNQVNNDQNSNTTDNNEDTNQTNSDQNSNTSNNNEDTNQTNSNQNSNTTNNNEDTNQTNSEQNSSLPTTESNSNTKISPIIAIGDSTVRTAEKGGKLYGWADTLSGILKNPKVFFNHAESGKSSRSLILNEPRYATNGFWGNGDTFTIEERFKLKGARQRIDEVKQTNNGGYLFIQFGHNDQVADGTRANISSVTRKVYSMVNNNPTGVTVFEDNLLKYANYAASNNIIPVFITPMITADIGNGGDCPQDWSGEKGFNCQGMHIYTNSPSPYNNVTINYPQAMKDLVNRVNTNNTSTENETMLYENLKKMGKKAILLDLTVKSARWATSYVKRQKANGDTRKSNDILSDYIVDGTHYNQAGAKEIGKLIRELACDNITGDIDLCNQFTEQDYRKDIQTRAWGQDDI